MRKIIFLFLLIFSSSVYAQNKKPACKPGELHNCVGTIEWAGGQKYIGEMMN